VGIVVFLFGVGFACLIVWRALVYVVPAYLGLTAGLWSLAQGAGVGAVVVGLIVMAAAIAVGRAGVQSKRPGIRWAMALLFAAPAAYAGYCAARDVVALVVASQFWQVSLSALTALCVAATAFARLRGPLEA
jgi:hypothetical protein